MDRNGPLSRKIDGKDYTITSELLGKLIKQCEDKLTQILPSEFINSDPEDKRADASRDREIRLSADQRPLFLGAVSEDPLVSENLTNQVLISHNFYTLQTDWFCSLRA